MRLKKTFLVSFVLLVVVAAFVPFLTSAPHDCDCAPTYMGAKYVASICTWVENEDGTITYTYRHCFYEY